LFFLCFLFLWDVRSLSFFLLLHLFTSMLVHFLFLLLDITHLRQEKNKCVSCSNTFDRNKTRCLFCMFQLVLLI
jgi:hypothetical protein